jgi:hypothetical protein
MSPGRETVPGFFMKILSGILARRMRNDYRMRAAHNLGVVWSATPDRESFLIFA